MNILEPTVSGTLVVASSMLDFQAKVNGGNGSGVNWGVQAGDTCTPNAGVSSLGKAGGDSSVGTMPSNTANQAVAVYTAPAASAIPAAGFLTVTVTALQTPQTSGPCIVLYILPTTDSLLAGRWAFRFRGFSAAGLNFGIIGHFHADGAGNLADGLEDVNIAQADGSSAAFTAVGFTGTYSMDSPNHGTMTVTVTGATPWGNSPPANPPPTTMHLSFTLSADGFFGGLVEAESGAAPAYAGSGEFQFQGNTSKFTTANIVGNYIVSIAGPAGAGATAVNKGFVGRVDLAASTTLAGTIVAGVNSAGDDQRGVGQQALTGTYTIDDQARGHGTLHITATLNGTVTAYTISFYISYPHFFYALRTDSNAASASPDGILLGLMSFLPPTAPFNNTSLGSNLFEMQGINAQGHSSAAVGVLVGGAQMNSTTNGLLQGIVDLNDGGAVPGALPVVINSSAPNQSAFTIAPMGRGVLNVSVPTAAGAVTYNFVFYLNARGGFFLEQPASDGSNRGRSGGFFPQVVTTGPDGTFIASTEVGAASSDNGVAVIPISVSGNSAGFTNGTQDLSRLGSAATLGAVVSGTFTNPDANNRGTVAVTAGTLAGSSSATYYIASDTEALVLGTDATNLDPQIILFTNSLPVNH